MALTPIYPIVYERNLRKAITLSLEKSGKVLPPGVELDLMASHCAVAGQPVIRFDEWLKEWAAMHFPSGRKDLTPEEVGTMLETWPYAMWHRARRHVYRVSPALVEMLRHIDPSDIPMTELRLPFPAIYIELPRTEQYGEREFPSGTRYLAGAICVEDETALTISFCYVDLADGAYGANTTLLIPKEPGKTIGESVNAAVLDSRKTMMFDRLEGRVDTPLQVRLQHVIHEFLSVVVYTVLYCTTEGSDVARPKYGPTTERMRKFPNKNPTWQARHRVLAENESIVIDVGKNLELAREMLPAGGSGTALQHRVMVPGHFKQQPYGPRNSLRKRIFIAPYMKGPDGAPIRHRDYRVKNSQLE